MKRVLLTGATGFVGQYCLSLLMARGYDVHAVSSKEIYKSASGICWHQADLLDSRQILELIVKVQPTHLLHFAWFGTAPGKYWTSPENILWVQASLELLLAFVQNGGQRVVIAGTCAEYDWRYGYCSERLTPLVPATLYGICKHSLQMMMDMYAKQLGLSAAWGRIFYLYGPSEHPNRLVASVIRSLLHGEPACCSHGNQIRDCLYVKDVADAFVAVLEGDVSGPINIASGCPLALKEIIYRIAKKLGREDLVILGAIPAPQDEPPLLVADVNRLSNEVGWLPNYNLDLGLEETISWWRDQLREKEYD